MVVVADAGHVEGLLVFFDYYVQLEEPYFAVLVHSLDLDFQLVPMNLAKGVRKVQ